MKHKFQQNIIKIISRGTSRPLAGRDACLRDLFANKKLFLFAKRPSGGASKYFWNLPPAGLEVPGPTPPARLTGGRHLFSEFFPSGSHFRILYFYFLKKTHLLTQGTPRQPGSHSSPPSGLRAFLLLKNHVMSAQSYPQAVILAPTEFGPASRPEWASGENVGGG
jgi:hypothetical protein